jgi:hypothetical protein
MVSQGMIPPAANAALTASLTFLDKLILKI